ncbi:hypothetical protein P7K49_025986, partial [Saguinus oedipus]
GVQPCAAPGERGERARAPSQAERRGEGEALLGQSRHPRSPRTPSLPAPEALRRSLDRCPLSPRASGPSSNRPPGGRALPLPLLYAPARPSGLPWRPQESG